MWVVFFQEFFWLLSLFTCPTPFLSFALFDPFRWFSDSVLLHIEVCPYIHLKAWCPTENKECLCCEISKAIFINMPTQYTHETWKLQIPFNNYLWACLFTVLRKVAGTRALETNYTISVHTRRRSLSVCSLNGCSHEMMVWMDTSHWKWQGKV